MNAIIIEDEAIAAERLEELIKKTAPDEIKIIAKLTSIRESVKWLMENTCDLIFLDIQLSDGLSFNIFDRVDVNTPIIFTTAYDDYAIKAFNHNSIAYLLKPIKQKQLAQSLEKFRSLKSAFQIDFEKLVQEITGKKAELKKRFLIQFGDKIKKIETNEIAYFFAESKNVFLRTYQNQQYPIDYTLDKLETILDNKIYFRINRKYIINIESIANMTAFSRGRIKLFLNPPTDDRNDALVSVERSQDFKKWMDS